MDKVKDDSRAFNNLGVLAWLSGNTEAAKEWFQKAASVEPEKANANLEKWFLMKMLFRNNGY